MKRIANRTLSLLVVCILLLGSVSVGPAAIAADTGYQNGDVIEFGSYPQSRVTDAETLAALNALEPEWKSYGYHAMALGYEPNYDPAYRMVAKDFMRYADVALDGKNYRAVFFSDYRPKYASQMETQSNTAAENYTYQNGYERNTVYWFSWDPVRWRVLDAETGLVFSENVIDSQAFSPVTYQNPEDKLIYRDKTCSAYASEYAQSFVREWLTDRAHENGFANEAFSDWQWSRIALTDVNNQQVQDAYKPYVGADSKDQVFLFSVYELKGDVEYKIYKDFSEWNYPSRILYAGPTDYACCQGLQCDTYAGRTVSSWMTRTIISAPDNIYGPSCAIFHTSGNLSGQQINGHNGVRPAMRIDPELLRSGNLTQPQTVSSGTCGENVQWAFDEESGVLSLTGTGAMDSLGAFEDYGYSVWKDDIQFVAAAEGVTSIGAHAFEGCPILEEVILGENVTQIGEAAFTGCPRLMNVTLLSGEISANGAFPDDRMDWMLVFPEENMTAIALAKRYGAAWIPVSYKDNTLSFGGTITVHDGYAYGYLPMFVERYGSAQKVYFNRLVFADVKAEDISSREYTGSMPDGCLTMHYVEVTLLYISPDGEQSEITYDRMIELLQSGDYRAFKLRVTTPTDDGEEKTQEEIIYEKLEDILPFMPRKVLRLVSRAINFIVSIFKKK